MKSKGKTPYTASTGRILYPHAFSNYEKYGVNLPIQHQKFIWLYIETSDPVEAYIGAGFSASDPKGLLKQTRDKAYTFLKKTPIQKELRRYYDNMAQESIASREEVLEFWTKTMRGETTAIETKLVETEAIRYEVKFADVGGL